MGSNFPYQDISVMRGLNKSRDVLSLLPGQLSKNCNYLYKENGGLRERGGGAQLTENPSTGTDPVFSLGNYVAPDGDSFLVTNQDATVYYYDSGWNDLSLSLTADLKIRWEDAGFEDDRALYGVNGVDSVVKISGNTPAGSTVANSPTDMIQLKLHKNRLFGINNADTLYFTEALDFDTWNTTVNTIEIAPGVDGNCYALEVYGDALFIFKENGVYCLPNAVDPVPDLNWQILRTDAPFGTQSTASVKRTNAGIMYFSTDNFIRVLGPRTTFSSGEYTLGNSGAPIVSFDIQDDIINEWSFADKAEVEAVSYEDYYIISVQSVNNSGSYNDLTYFADVSKWNQLPGIVQLQPYWGQFTGFDYNFFVTQSTGTDLKLYGAKGVTGNIQETLNDSVNNDAGGAIESKAIIGWYPIGGSGLYKKIRQFYFSGYTEAWNIEIVVNAYRLGQQLPTEGEGCPYTFTVTTTSGGNVGTAVVGTDAVGFIGTSSELYRSNLRGHYFTAEFGNCNADEYTEINKFIVYFKPIKQS